MLPLIISLVAGFTALSSLGYLFYWRLVIRRTAIVIIHPFNLGHTPEEMRSKLLSLPTTQTETDIQNIIRKHQAYYAQLEKALRRILAGTIVLLEEEHAIDRSIERIVPLTRHLKAVNLYREIEFITAPTKVGFARLLGCTWEDLIEEFQKKGIKQIVIVGSYVATSNAKLLPQKGEGNYCANETYYQLSKPGCFQVYLELNGCYVFERDGEVSSKYFSFDSGGHLVPLAAREKERPQVNKSELKRRKKQSRNSRRKRK